MYNLGQLALLLTALVLIAERCRALLYRAPLDADPFIRALCEAIEQARWSCAMAMVQAAGSSWIGRLVRPMLEAHQRGEDRDASRDEAWIELKEDAGKYLYAIRGLGSVASALGLLGVLFEFRGVMGTLAGATGGQQLAVQHAVTTMVLGLTTSTICFSALRLLRRWLKQLAIELRRAAADVDVALATIDVSNVPVTNGSH